MAISYAEKMEDNIKTFQIHIWVFSKYKIPDFVIMRHPEIEAKYLEFFTQFDLYLTNNSYLHH